MQTSELETYTDLELSMVWPVCPYQKQVKIKRIRYIRMEWMYYVVAQNICMTHDWKYMHSDCKTASWRMAQPRFRKRQFLANGFWSFVSQTSLEDLPYLVMTCPFQISLQLTFAYTAWCTHLHTLSREFGGMILQKLLNHCRDVKNRSDSKYHFATIHLHYCALILLRLHSKIKWHLLSVLFPLMSCLYISPPILQALKTLKSLYHIYSFAFLHIPATQFQNTKQLDLPRTSSRRYPLKVWNPWCCDHEPRRTRHNSLHLQSLHFVSPCLSEIFRQLISSHRLPIPTLLTPIKGQSGSSKFSETSRHVRLCHILSRYSVIAVKGEIGKFKKVIIWRQFPLSDLFGTLEQLKIMSSSLAEGWICIEGHCLHEIAPRVMLLLLLFISGLWPLLLVFHLSFPTGPVAVPAWLRWRHLDIHPRPKLRKSQSSCPPRLCKCKSDPKSVKITSQIAFPTNSMKFIEQHLRWVPSSRP